MTMPLIQSSQDYLPSIDKAPSQQDITSARALITAELPSDHKTNIHERIPHAIESNFSDLIESEHARLSSGAPKVGGIDLSRYEAQDAPATNDADEWRSTLQRAYSSAEYLQSRVTNLSLLETYGKNAWLISNDQLEQILRDVEKEVVARKIEVETLAAEMRNREEASRGELETLEQTWKVGVGRMLEVEVAAEGLRQAILDRKRLAAK